MSANVSTVQLANAKLQVSRVWRRWLLLIPILILSLIIRVGYLGEPAFVGDLRHFTWWLQLIQRDGLLNFYEPDVRFGVWDRVYPPLSMLTFEGVRLAYGEIPHSRVALADTQYVTLLKLLPLLSELAIIATVYFWLIDRPLMRVVVPLLLAVHPGLVVTSAWWGQYDSPFTLFLVLALIALNRKRPLLAWGFFALALLLKQPAVVLGPLFLVLTFRRFGWRTTVGGIIVCGLISAAAFAPFIVGSGLEGALSPYLRSGDVYPYLTNNAYNFWYALAAIHNGGHVAFTNPNYMDTMLVFSAFTFKHAGLLLFGGFVLLMMVVMWRRSDQDNEFVWAAALYMGFFMLLTQVHERYLYPAAVLALIALAQDRRMAWVALSLALTYSYNILGVLIPYRTVNENPFGTDFLPLPTALLNIVSFIFITRYSLMEAKPDPEPAATAQPSISQTVSAT